MSIKMLFRFAGLASLLILSVAVVYAGDLEPPAPPGPTMTPLDQLAGMGDPRIDVNGLVGDSTAVHVINQPGSYYLTDNIYGASGKSGVLVDTDNVTIDLNGFSLLGVAGSGSGIVVDSFRYRIAVKNGMISGWGEDGIHFLDSMSSSYMAYYTRFKDLIVDNNGGYGILTGSYTSIKDCVIGNSTLGAIKGYAYTSVNNVVSDNGFLTGNEAIVRGSITYGHINVSNGGVVSECRAQDIYANEAAISNSSAWGDVHTTSSALTGCYSQSTIHVDDSAVAHSTADGGIIEEFSGANIVGCMSSAFYRDTCSCGMCK